MRRRESSGAFLFALGDGRRTGTSGRFVVRLLTVAGFLLLSACHCVVFAPIYWFLLVRSIRRLHAERSRLMPAHE